MPSLASGKTSCTACASTCAVEWRSTLRPSGESSGTGVTSVSRPGTQSRSRSRPPGSRTTTIAFGPEDGSPAAATASAAAVPAGTTTGSAGGGTAGLPWKGGPGGPLWEVRWAPPDAIGAPDPVGRGLAGRQPFGRNGVGAGVRGDHAAGDRAGGVHVAAHADARGERRPVVVQVVRGDPQCERHGVLRQRPLAVAQPLARLLGGADPGR